MSLIVTGIIDGPLPGGLPKAVELYVTADIADLSSFGLGSANNGDGSDGEEFTFPGGAATAGSYIYVASEAVEFTNYLGFAPDYVTSAVNINGDDAIELFNNGAVIDLFGDINVDGTGQPWEHMDGWAYRNPGAVASPTFDLSEWTFSGPNALDTEISNATAASQFPVGSFSDDVEQPVDVQVVINEIDSDQDSTDSAEFIEIYDGGVGNASLTGLSLVLFNGSSDMEYRTIALDGFSTNADGYFVAGSADVPNVDMIAFTVNGLQNGPDAVALYSGTPPTMPTTENLIDAVVYGTNELDDTSLLTALGLDTQYNEAENGDATADALARVQNGSGAFVAQAPTPGAQNVIVVPPPSAEITLISDIQGNGGTQADAVIGVDDRSALVDQIVTVQAIVTADFQDGLFGGQGDLNGFYIQEEEIDYDFNDLSSEGIFIFDGSTPAVNVAIGDLVEITGTVTEFGGQTQITASFVQVLDSNQTLPTAVDVVFPAASVMIDSNGEYVANLEAYEGMRVNVAQDMTITEMFNLDRFGTYDVNADGRVIQYTQNSAPDVAGYDTHQREVASNTLQLDDGLSSQNPGEIQIIDGNDGILTAEDSFRMGDALSGLTGVLGYSFDAFKVNAAEGIYSQQNPRPETPQDIGGNFKVASLNVLNYFTTIDTTGNVTDIGLEPRGADSPEELERQALKLVNAIVAMDADVLGLIEIENDFAGDSFAIMDIVGRVNDALGAQVYGFVDPGQEFIGTDAISNGLIYKVDEVALRGDMAILETFDGRDFLDPLGSGRDLNRPAIAQTFEDVSSGQTITVSVNHLKSKGSLSGLEADEAQGDGQGNNNATRTEAAHILADWLNSDPTAQGSENVLILGDLNAYAQEDPVQVLASEGFIDLAAQALVSDAYSYVFDGQVGTLDYALANGALADDLVGVTEWHINSDEADALDYNLDFGRDPALFNGESASRNSDHDPVIVSFQFDPEFNLIAGTDRKDVLFGTTGRDEIRAGRGNDFINGGGDDDLIFGEKGKDLIFGGDGNDTIAAGADKDVVFGGAGDDVILAGTGNKDSYWGGKGADIFVFSAELAADTYKNNTTIFDFDTSEDVMDLGGATIERVRERLFSVELELDGGRDNITLLGVRDFDDIVFVDDLPIG